MYHVQTDFPCNRRANELAKFIKNHICSLDPTPSIYKILRTNSLYLSYTKKEKFLTDL
jgi:hypothetical protein